MSRRSIRAYKPTPVSPEVLTQVLEAAVRAPSALNTQPWTFDVLGGTVLADIKEAVQQLFLAGVQPNPDLGQFPTFTGVYRQRQIDLARGLFQLMGIAKEDHGRRAQWMLRMFRFFDAPNAIIVGTDEAAVGLASVFGLGTVSQSIALAALDFGLGTCMQREPVSYPHVIRNLAGIPDSRTIFIAIAVGYPDWEFPANRLRSHREPLSSVVHWHGL